MTIDASALGLSIPQIKSKLKKDQPEIIGVTGTTPTIYDAFEIAEAAKEACPRSFTVLKLTLKSMSLRFKFRGGIKMEGQTR